MKKELNTRKVTLLQIFHFSYFFINKEESFPVFWIIFSLKQMYLQVLKHGNQKIWYMLNYFCCHVL